MQDSFVWWLRVLRSYMGPADIGLVLLCCIKAENDMQIRPERNTLTVSGNCNHC